jgi:hypothetical protein
MEPSGKQELKALQDELKKLREETIRYKKFAAAKKPQRTPVGLLFVLWMIQHDEDVCWLSYESLADRAGCSPSTAQRLTKKYERLGWVTRVSGKRGSHTNRYQVEIDKLPYSDFAPTVATEWAFAMAKKYFDAVSTIQNTQVANGDKDTKKALQRRTRAAWKGWKQRWALVLDKLLKLSGGNDKLLVAVLNEAISNPNFSKRAMLGPDRLKSRWPLLLEGVKGLELARRIREQHQTYVENLELMHRVMPAFISSKLHEFAQMFPVAEASLGNGA